MLTNSQQAAANVARFALKVVVVGVLMWAFLVLWLSIPASGQDMPKLKPKPAAQSSKLILRLELGTLAGSAAADYVSTRGALGRGWKEQNPIFGSRPGSGRLWATGGLITGLQGAVLTRTERSNRAWVRWAGRAGWAWVTSEHVRFTIHNRRLGRPNGNGVVR
jgi:hypothetical protein